MLTCKYAKFSLPRKVTYLNCAYMAPLLKTVEKAGIRGLRLKRNPAEIAAADFFTTTRQLREAFAKLIHASDPDRVALIPSASYGLAAAARNVDLRKGDEVIVAAEQFPSNFYVWKSRCDETGATLKVVSPHEGTQSRGRRWNAALLESISPATRVVALAHAHWADGTRFDLQALRKRTQDVNALLIIDGTQSVGALPFNIEEIRPDALVCACYKWLLGPYSLGLAWYGDAFNDGKPLEENWINREESEDFTRLVNYAPAYLPGAQRYNVGEQSNFILVPMALKAIEQINRWGVSNIQAYCEAIGEPAILQLQEQGFVIEEAAYRTAHLFGVRHPALTDIGPMKENLARQNIHVSVRGTAIRVSPHVYNDAADLEKLVRVLRRAV